MRRTARVLYATALAGAALSVAASAASADPAAEVSPGSVEPGGTVTISVTCDGVGGAPPEAIDASSQGFQEGKVQLHRVEGGGAHAAGAAAYRGTAHIPTGAPDGAGGPAPSVSGSGEGYEETGVLDRTLSSVAGTTDAENGDVPPAAPDSGGSDTVAPDAVEPPPVATDPEQPGSGYPDPVTPDPVTPDDVGPDAVGPDTVPEPAAPDTVPEPVGPDTAPAAPVAPEAGGAARGEWGVDGVCPAPQGGHGKQWSASYSVAKGAPAHEPSTGTGAGTGERPPTVQQGVQAGRGGAFTDSVPALVAGGLLIAGAGCAAVHRLRNRRA
ncbi:hypothetical protein ACFV99_38065 [Streptomyces sp. NPDC059944]|uniref:hypothetical protein n=1 Tax=unclassified Streptomyces TaxID=2593676 RepID=UPI0036559D3B